MTNNKLDFEIEYAGILNKPIEIISKQDCSAYKFCEELKHIFDKLSPTIVTLAYGAPMSIKFLDGSEVGLGYAINKTGYFNIVYNNV